MDFITDQIKYDYCEDVISYYGALPDDESRLAFCNEYGIDELMGEDELKEEIKRNDLAREVFVAAYEKEAFDASGYHFGQKIEVEGESLYVTGAYTDGRGNVFLKLNRSKKDGTMSKVRRWTLLAPQIK